MGDPRLEAQLLIRRNPRTGRRQILVDGAEFPTFTRGEIEVNPVVHWPEHGMSKEPVIVGYEVKLICFVPNLHVEDPEVLAEIPLPPDA